MTAKTTTVKLDWTKLLGFDQADRSAQADGAKLTDPRMAKVGGKFGVKIGGKLPPG